MDSGYSGLSSGTLPGGWSSSWTLSDGAREYWAEQAPKLPKRLRGNKSSQDEENQNLAFHDVPSSKGRVVLYSVDTNICGHADSDSSLSDEESILSDDFYSFISQEDHDITLSPSVTTPGKQANDVEEISPPNAPAEPDFDLTGLNSSLHLPTLQDVTLPDDVPAAVFVPLLLHASEPSFEARTSSSSSRFQLDSSSSQADSVTDPDGHSERASIHSNYSSLNYAGVCHLIDRLDSRTTPQDIEYNDTLFFSQPDGNNAWTLSLEPTPSFTEPGLSTTSLSVESSSASDSGCTSEIFQQQPVLVPVEVYSPSLDHPPTVNDDTEASHHHRSGSRPSVEALPLEQSSTHPQSSHFTIDHRSRNVIQKTKEFCRKFKRFITSKPSKSRSGNNLLLAPGAYTLVDVDTQLAQEYNFPRPGSAVSSQRPGRFMRSAKISSPSVALSEYPNHQTGSAVDDIHSYDYHARPKTLQEIKSRRRFSLPAFSRASTPAGTSARANIGLFASERTAGHIG
ncbi:hypothetical protein M413DRAFT_439878 [Hebeloma cylindrosporum]|uniref:Uncharacterized protein n=1 Tax=Hebeloma cylindrosporum TaxID=76867 RepID=A0A0C3CVK5_HEBCY|nr:hypothetical protein M413DRAFT_439878 [Hebeloma cylindrosporum h7]